MRTSEIKAWMNAVSENIEFDSEGAHTPDSDVPFFWWLDLNDALQDSEIKWSGKRHSIESEKVGIDRLARAVSKWLSEWEWEQRSWNVGKVIEEDLTS